MSRPKVIVIVGPTASGKTDLSFKIARQFDGEIIAVDSRTVFRGMDIGTAKPVGSKGERGRNMERGDIRNLFEDRSMVVDGIPHWGIDIVDPDEIFSVADFKKYADKKIFDIASREKTPMLVGGTGLYINAVVDNWSLTEVEQDADLRAELELLSQDQLEKRLGSSDQDALETIDLANRRRLIRAIEIVEKTGGTLAQSQIKNPPKFDILMFGLKIDRQTLYDRVDYRVDSMIAGGLVDEVRGLRDKYGCEINAMTGIGYRQICAFLGGYMKLKDAIEVLKRDTRHYAKRQLTWFKRDDRIHWVRDYDEVVDLIGKFLRG